jgi:hypothetical protein
MVHNERLQYLLPELAGPELCGGAASVEGIVWKSSWGTPEVSFLVYQLMVDRARSTMKLDLICVRDNTTAQSYW